MSTLVYKYGLLAPIEQTDLVRRELSAANIYRNTLVELERGRRQAVRAVEAQAGDIPALTEAVQTAETELDAAVSDVTKHRAKTRRRDEPLLMSDRVKVARAARKTAKDALNAARKILRDDISIVDAKDQIDGRYYELGRAARAVRGDRDYREQRLSWGTGGLIEKAHDQSRKMPLWDGLAANDPRFARFSGEGTIGVQIQGGITLSELTSDTQIRIMPSDKAPAKRRTYAVLWMRLGSEGKAPIWAKFPMVLHRPLPPNAIIKEVTVCCRKIGPREEWTCQFTLKLPDIETPPSGDRRLAVNFGWRVEDGKLRVCTLRGKDDERAQYIHFDPRGLSKADELRATRDDEFNAAREALIVRLGTLELPEWLLLRTVKRGEKAPSKAQALAYMAQWKSPARLASLVRTWRDNRFDGDDDTYLAIEGWRYHDQHMWRYESDQRTGALRQRKDYYRNEAAKFARQYDILVLDDTDYSALARGPKRGGKDDSNDGARSNRFQAAVSELKQALRNAFSRPGKRIVEVAAGDSSKICHNCAAVEDYDAAASIQHTCSACSVTWDQDDNHCRVLIERSNDALRAVGARDQDNPSDNNGVASSKWAKAKAGKLDKVSRLEGARKAS